MATASAPPDRPPGDMVRDCLPGHSLPQRLYVDPAVFAADLDAIYRRHWLLAGPSCRIPRPGDHFTWTIGDDSIIVLRDEAGVAPGAITTSAATAGRGSVSRPTAMPSGWSVPITPGRTGSTGRWPVRGISPTASIRARFACIRSPCAR